MLLLLDHEALEFFLKTDLSTASCSEIPRHESRISVSAKFCWVGRSFWPVFTYHGMMESWMLWLGRDIKIHPVPIPFPWAGTSSTKPELHPAWPGTIPGVEHSQGNVLPFPSVHKKGQWWWRG